MLASLAKMTTYGYNVVMIDVRIAELKSRLSEYLRKVRAGKTITVLDRDTPIARIVPYEAHGASLKIRPPQPGTPKLQHIALPPAVHVRRDIVKLLLEERQGER